MLFYVFLLLGATLPFTQASTHHGDIDSDGHLSASGSATAAEPTFPTGTFNAAAPDGLNAQVVVSAPAAALHSPSPAATSKAYGPTEYDPVYVGAYQEALDQEFGLRSKYAATWDIPRRLTQQHYDDTMKVISAYMLASALAPHRKEPHYRIAVLYRRLEDYKRCYEHGVIADDLPPVADTLKAGFYDPFIHQFGVLEEICICAYHAGYLDRGRKACEDLKAAFLERRSADESQDAKDTLKRTEFQLSMYKSMTSRMVGKQDGDESKLPCLAVGVLSASQNRQARNAIRATWKQSPKVCRFNFYIGTPQNETALKVLQNESEEHKDIVIVDIAEAYKNITHQTFEMVKTAEADPGVTHLLKLDDDSYPRMDLLTSTLAEQIPDMLTKPFYFGCMRQASPEETLDVARPVLQPLQFALGAGYALSADLAAGIAAAEEDLKYTTGAFLQAEDVSLALWVEFVRYGRGMEGVTYRHTSKIDAGGVCADHQLVTHYVLPSMQECLWREGGRCEICLQNSY